MKQVQHWLDTWHLSDPQLIATTHTSQVYRVSYSGGFAALKLLNLVGMECEASSCDALLCFAGEGAVKLIKHADNALLLEWLPGKKLSELCYASKDKQASEILLGVIDKLHRFSGELPAQIPTLQERFQSLFHYLFHYANSGIVSPSISSSEHEIILQSAQVAQELLSTESNKSLLHGDIHHDNIIFDSKNDWLAIDPQCLYGEATYDLANSFYNPDDQSRYHHTEDNIIRRSEIYAKHLNISQSRILQFAFAHGGLSVCWQLEDKQDPHRRMAIMHLINKVLLSNSLD